jgi:hypothetical protein
MASALFPSFKSLLLSGSLVGAGGLSNGDINIVLMNSSYSYSSSQTTWGSSGVSTNEAATQGTYTTGVGGTSLGTITVGISGTSANATLSTYTVQWTGTITAHAALILNWNSGTPSDSQLIAFIDLNALNGGTDPSSSGSSATFTLDWTAVSGVIISLT